MTFQLQLVVGIELFCQAMVVVAAFAEAGRGIADSGNRVTGDPVDFISFVVVFPFVKRIFRCYDGS